MCFRTYRTFGIQVIKNPARIQPPAGSQRLQRHQLHYWSIHWNFLTPGEKQNYDELGEAAGISGYDYYIQEKHDSAYLRMAPKDNYSTSEYFPDRHLPPWRLLSICNQVDDQWWTYVDFPLNLIPRNLAITKAEFCLFYDQDARKPPEGERLDCHKIIEDWDMNTLVWNNAPACSATETSHVNIPDEGEWIILDVTSDINDLISTGGLFYGWRANYHTTVPANSVENEISSTKEHYYNTWPYLELTL